MLWDSFYGFGLSLILSVYVGLECCQELHLFTFFFVALFYVYTTKRTQFYVTTGLLSGYLFLMCFVPVPGIGFPDLSIPEKKLGSLYRQFFITRCPMAKNMGSRRHLKHLPSNCYWLTGCFCRLHNNIKKRTIRKIGRAFCYGDYPSYSWGFNAVYISIE